MSGTREILGKFTGLLGCAVKNKCRLCAVMGSDASKEKLGKVGNLDRNKVLRFRINGY